MSPESRYYIDQRDLGRVGRFLAATFAALGRPHNWQIDRWVNLRYSSYADSDPGRQPDWESEIRVWEAKDDLVGLVFREGPGFYALQVHPDFRLIESDMLDWCELDHQRRRPADQAKWPLRMEVYDWDAQRGELLTKRGFQRHQRPVWYRRRSLEEPIPSLPVPAGFRLRTQRGDVDDRRRYVDALCAIFPGYRDHWIRTYPSCSDEQRREIAVRSTCPRMDAPQYRAELDLRIETDQGELACVCTMWLDDANGLSIIEPMGTCPDQRGRGLARAIMLEGMRRSRDLGARWAVTTSYTDAAHRAYESVGLAAAESIAEWSKAFESSPR